MNTSLQQAIFDHIRRQVPPEQKLADVLSGLLHLQKGAVYKRLSGATPLTLEELAILAEHFTLPVHELFYPDKPMFMAEFSAAAAPVSVMEYLRLLEADLSPLAGDPSARVWHVTVGLPDFYYYYFEELTLFQVFTWERMVWRNPAWQHRRFSLDVPEKKEIMTLATRLAHFFSRLPVVEIWNEYVLDNLFQQILYVAQSRLYEEKEDIRRLMAAAARLVDHLEQMAFHNRRFVPEGSPSDNDPAWSLYFNETMKNNIFFLVESSRGAAVYATLDNPNFFKTTDAGVVEHIRGVFERLIAQAVPVGGADSRYHHAYFEKLKNRLSFFEEQVMRVMEGG
ncbi:MAG: hypothetical protein CMN32_04440 [Saprospirales bacterium]|nr:hypothetical protein [Saprospirales bacterium]